MKITFKKNKIMFGQDCSFYRNIPSNIIFKVEPFTNDKIILRGIGYGDTSDRNNKNIYGNGAIYVYIKDLPKKYQDLIITEFNLEKYKECQYCKGEGKIKC